MKRARHLRAVQRMTRVTLVQHSSDGRDVADDLEAVRAEVRAHRDSDLVIFPEFAVRRTVDDLPARRLASEGPAVIFGEIREHGGRISNLATFADARGTLSYAKSHVHWTEAFTPGYEFPVADTPLGPTGMLICFDAAFAEVPASLALAGARAIVNLSAIPSHFPLKIVHRRLVACSVFNQVFTFFVNRTGSGFLGGSAVVDPQGEVLAVAGEHDRSLTVDVDMSEVDSWRAIEPVHAHRRPDLYGRLTRPAPVPLASTSVEADLATTASTADEGGTY